MGTLDRRLSVLEGQQISTDLRGMSIEQLDAHLAALEAGSPDWFRAMVVGIQRRGSRLPLKRDR